MRAEYPLLVTQPVGFSKLCGWLRWLQSEEVSEMVRHSEELNADLPLVECMGIAPQPLSP